jgi:hypothetical protein
MLASSLRLPASALGSSGMGQPSPPMLGTGTPGTWSHTGANLEAGVASVPKKSNAGLFAALGVVGLLVLGGGGFAAMSALRDKKAPAAAATVDAAAAASASAAEQAERDRLAKLEAERIEAEAATKKAEADRAAAELAKQQAEAPQVAPVPPATAAATATPHAAAPRPAPPRPAVAHETPRPSSGTSGGRKIRTSL